MTQMLGKRRRMADAVPLRARAAAPARAVMARACAVLACAAFVLMPAGAASAASQAPAPSRTVMILLDNNSSGGWVAIARQSALAYARALPPNVHAGLVTFATRWQLVMRPTTDRARLEAAVSAVQGAGGSYYNSQGVDTALAHVISAVPRLRTDGSRLLVICDGENLAGPVSPAAIPTDVIAPRLDDDDVVSGLWALASTTGGHLAGPSRAAALATAAFGRLPDIRPPAARTHRPPPKIHGAAAGIAVPHVPWSLVAGIAALFAGLFLLVLTGLRSAVRVGQARDLADRIGQYGPQQSAEVATDESAATSRVGRAAQDVTKRLMPPATQERLAERLDLAGVARKPTEWALLGACLGVVIAAGLSLVTSYVLLGVLAGALIGWLTMRVSLSMRIVRRRVAFGEQLPDTLQLLASALRAGFSLAQSVDAVVREDTQPIAGEFSRALSEVRLGGNLEDGLDAVANRMDSDDLHWTVTAIRIQQGVGGNLAEILLTIAGTIRERAFLRRQVRALSAEGRLSAYVLIALPVLIGIWLFVSAPQYMRPLYTTPEGQFILIAAIVAVVLGALWMRKMIKIKV
jgi:Flp pilus assembly protein TadB